MAFIQTHFFVFLFAILLVRRLFGLKALERIAFFNLRAWSRDFSPAQVDSLVRAYSGPMPDARQDEAVQRLEDEKYQIWRAPQGGGNPPWYFALLPGGEEEASGRNWKSMAELLSLMSVLSLLVVSYAMVGGYECAVGVVGGKASAPSYHVTIAAVVALVASLVYLAGPLVAHGMGHVEVHFALCFGGIAACLGTLGYALLYASTGEGARQVPWVDVGAPLGAGVGGALGQGGALAMGLLIALYMGAIGALFTIPALRMARHFSMRMDSAEALAAGAHLWTGRLRKVWARTIMYAPALVAALWFRPLIQVTPTDAVPCTRLAQLNLTTPEAAAPGGAWGAGVSRDCRAGLVRAGAVGGESWLGLVPLWVLDGAGGEWGKAHAADLAGSYWIGESSWLRWRLAIAAGAAVLMLWQWRDMLQGHLDGAWREAVSALRRAGRRAEQGKAPLPCKYEHRLLVLQGKACPRPAVECFLSHQRLKAIIMLPQAGMQLLAVPCVMLSLAILASRGTGLGGLGACLGLKKILEGAGVLPGTPSAAPARGSGDTLSELLYKGGDLLFGQNFGRVLAQSKEDIAATLFAPAAWRPVLSYLLFCTLITWWLLGELALMYWRVMPAEASLIDEPEEESSKDK